MNKLNKEIEAEKLFAEAEVTLAVIQNLTEKLNGFIAKAQALSEQIPTDEVDTDEVDTDEVDTDDEVPSVCHGVFHDKVFTDFWWGCQKEYDRKNFAGFVNYDMPNRLSIHKRYGMSIGPVVFLGDRIQMLVLLFEKEDWDNNCNDYPAGLLIEDYKVGSAEFDEMVTSVFAPWHESIISVEVDRINDAFGTIGLKRVGGKFKLDWRSFDAEQTPQSQAFEFSWSVADRIKS